MLGEGIIERFEIAFPDAAIDDMRGRVAATRWAPEPGNDDWRFGVNGAWLRDLAAYWADGFDWRAQEAAINRCAHYRTVIDGVPIHFIHMKGKGDGTRPPTPLILTHGWPWTFWDFGEMIGPLTDPAAHGGDAADAFDVVIPSLPGATFSNPLTRTDIGYRETADLWVKLMAMLGHERFGAFGGDAGAFVTAMLGHAHADRLIGAHFSMPVIPGLAPGQAKREDYAPEERMLSDRRVAANSTHLLVHSREPQTISWAMHDSPVGMAAWLLHRRRAWSDCAGDPLKSYSRDFLLTNISLFWLTECFATSVRFYVASRFQEAAAMLHDRSPALPVPCGYAIFPRDIASTPRAWVERHANVVRWTMMERGGHFAAAEEPVALTAELRAFFRMLRNQP